MELDWEAYKYLSRNVLSEQELDVYYFLTYYFLEREHHDSFSDKLDSLLARAISESITVNEKVLKKHIRNFDTKKSLK